jgi:hypothetical protein
VVPNISDMLIERYNMCNTSHTIIVYPKHQFQASAERIDANIEHQVNLESTAK